MVTLIVVIFIIVIVVIATIVILAIATLLTQERGLKTGFLKLPHTFFFTAFAFEMDKLSQAVVNQYAEEENE